NDMYFFTKQVKSPTQMERDAVCRGQYHGWLKERVGGHIIRRCNVHHCEQTGIVGRMGGVFSIIEDCHIHHICNSQQLGGAETAGIKLHAAIDVVIRRNHIHNCIMGVWCDWQAQGARITQNLMHDNHRPDGVQAAQGAMFSNDIFIEVSHGPAVIDNNILLSKVSVVMPSEGIACVNNLMCGSFALINSGVDSIVNGQREPRYTPYHIRHRTEVAGFMTILHGDDRIYNNIFIQKYPVSGEKKPSDNDNDVAGTAAFDIFPSEEEWRAPFDAPGEPDMGGLAQYHFGHLPVWVGGNAYLNGASVSRHEHNACINTVETAAVTVEEKEDGIWFLRSNLGQVLDGFTTRIMHSDTLGCAFEPEQRFENPDGSAIVFDSDYFGSHRGITAVPGPFADVSQEEMQVYDDRIAACR
ncbi:MAG: right-handed parallel beta-helix repeat-containing protein, partial [Oscillospiraceae bacterium]|nr:right-handed parallel beta-helix repeat-containing protein [Oscillospiraceae bacterium]